jgi:F-type H+-transporting ATPase subunit alpha
VEILKQGQFSPFRVEDQVAIIYCGTKGLLRDVPVNKVREFEADFLTYMRNKHANVLADLKAGKLDDTITSAIENAAKEISAKYKK